MTCNLSEFAAARPAFVSALRAGDRSAIQELVRMAEGGVGWCYYALGDIYLFGRYGVERDEVLGLEYLRLAFENGIHEAGHLFASHLSENGRNDDAQALFEKLSSEHYPPSMYQLGIGHLQEKWSKPDVHTGLSLLQCSADLGHLLSREYTHWYLLSNLRDSRDRLFHLLPLIRVKCQIKLYRLLFKHSQRIEI